jgi:hypothetical protein
VLKSGGLGPFAINVGVTPMSDLAVEAAGNGLLARRAIGEEMLFSTRSFNRYQ